MSRSTHQTLKGIMDEQSASQVAAMFAERDHDAMEWISKGKIKREVRKARRDGRAAPADEDGHVNAPDDTLLDGG
jgi:hypothetical protein